MSDPLRDDPTGEQYTAYMAAFGYFDARLFEGRLPRCMLSFSRRQRALGFFAPERWEHRGTRTHEISLNPDLLYRPAIEVMGTLVHEMVHLEQEAFGSPSGGGYHNAEWADRMEAIGLMPSHTGLPGGNRTGHRMTHYIVEGGPFHVAFREMPEDYLLPWQSGVLASGRKRDKNKVAYLCPACGVRAWGKPHLSLICGVCQAFFLPLGA